MCKQRDPIRYDQRIEDKQAEATAEYHLGNAYQAVAAILDLDVAEAAYRRSLDLHAPNDAQGRSQCLGQIGLVHYQRFRDTRKRQEPVETFFQHAKAARTYFLEALQLCPKDALTTLAPIHNSLGLLYADTGLFDKAREHYEQAAQYEEKVGNHCGAGSTRYNIALMYLTAAMREAEASQKRSGLLRARAYAEASLRDFRHYQVHAATDEASTQALLDHIDLALAQPHSTSG